MMKTSASLLFALLLSSSVTVFAQDEDGETNCNKCHKYFRGASLFSENDLLNRTLKNDDDNYTGSLKVSLRYDVVKKGEFWRVTSVIVPLPFSVHKEEEDLETFKFAAGFVLFTPQILDRAVVDPNDRPFASYKFLELTHSNRFIQSEHLQVFFDRTLMFGKMGKNLARDFQVSIHANPKLSGDRPLSTLGWSTQLAAGKMNDKGGYPGEFAFNYNATLGLIWCSKPEEKIFDLNPHLRPSTTLLLGTYLNKLSIGSRINVFGNYSGKDIFTTAATIPVDQSFILYFTPSFGYVMHSSVLQGRPFGLNKNDLYHLTSDQVKRGVWDFELVFGYQYKRFALLINELWRSQEFILPGAKKWHGWGGVNLIYTCPY